MRRRCFLGGMGSLVLFAKGLADEPEPPSTTKSSAAPKERPYEDGPLVPEDFRAAPPAANRLRSAYTATDIRYSVRYLTRSANETWSASLQSIEIHSVVICERSWNRALRDKRLLDHEQGHFDLAQIAALKLCHEFRRGISQERPLTANGPTRDEAIERLKTMVNKRVNEAAAEIREAHRVYDRETDYGGKRDQQKTTREQQEAEIRRLNEAIQSLSQPR